MGGPAVGVRDGVVDFDEVLTRREALSRDAFDKDS
jgi:hypothetical protein